jgi:hypothetical protein
MHVYREFYVRQQHKTRQSQIMHKHSAAMQECLLQIRHVHTEKSCNQMCSESISKAQLKAGGSYKMNYGTEVAELT